MAMKARRVIIIEVFEKWYSTFNNAFIISRIILFKTIINNILNIEGLKNLDWLNILNVIEKYLQNLVL